MPEGTLVGTTNLITNPSAELSSSGWTTFQTGGMTLALSDVTSFSWVGAKSFRMAITASTAAANATSQIFSSAFMTTIPGLGYSFSFRGMKDNVNFSLYAQINWYNASDGLISTTAQAIPSGHNADQWYKYVVSAVAPAGAVKAKVGITARHTTANLIGNYYGDGAQLEQRDNPTPYCDGDQPGCIWNGAAHASTSTRDAIAVRKGTVGKYGVVKILPELFIATKENIMQTNISDWIVQGNVRLETDSDVQMTFNAQILYPDRLEPFRDFLAPWLTVVYADGTFRKEQVGLYVIVPMRKTYTWHNTVGEADGRDLTWLLAQQSFAKTYSMKSGKVFVTIVRDILEGAGFTRHSIRNSTRVSGRSRSWPPGTSKLEIVNELLQACGMVKLFADRHGVLTSFPFVKINEAQVAATYYSGDDSVTVEPFVMSPSIDSLANYIVVVKDDVEATPANRIRATRINDSAASPTSIPNIGLIMKVVRDSNLADQAAADELADKLKDEWSNVYVEATLKTFPEPWHNVHEVYELDLQQRERFWKYWDNGLFIDLETGKRHKGRLLDDGSWANPDYKTPAAEELRGRFLVKGWNLTFSASDAAQTGGMEHTISRIVPYGNQVT